MAQVWDEKFEGTGYEESWTESVGASCTIDEDANPDDVSNPTGWVNNCLKYITVASTANYSYSQWGDADIRYFRAEVIFTDLSALDANDEYFQFLGLTNNSLATYCVRLYVYRTGGVNYILIYTYPDGNTDGGTFYGAIAEDTLYRIEVQWDSSANNNYEVKVNGASQVSGSLSAGHVDCGAVLLGTSAAAGEAWTGYFDLMKVDDAGWIGEEPIVIPLALYHLMQE